MTRAGPLRWVTGAGWLILAGGGEWQRGETAEIDDRLLVRASFSLPVAVLPTASGSLTGGEALLDYFADLGGPRGYVVPILAGPDAQDEESCRLLAEAGVIVLADGDPLALVQVLRGSPALRGMAEAYAYGALILGMGAGAACLGEWVLAANASEKGVPGLGWVSGAAVVPNFGGSAEEPALQAALRTHAGLVGIGVPEGTALALGPEGQVETWGEGEVTVVVAQ